MSIFKKSSTATATAVSSDYIRPASHSGTWYDAREEVLSRQLQGFLQDARGRVEECASEGAGGLQAIIAPHAGLSYSGATAAYAYSHVELAAKKCVFVIGPSHHVFTKKMLLSEATELETPVGNLRVDQEVCSELMATGLFDTMSAQVDEEEHSIEMHLPFVSYVMKQQLEIAGGGAVEYTVVPIMIGHLSSKSTDRYAEALLPYFQNPENLFVISSDFCHWGSRFRYQPYDTSKGNIHEYIEWLDKEAIALIESQNHDGFVEYLNQTDNTICGREAIKLLLALIGKSNKQYSTKCVRYAQSSPARSMKDSSVSYASALIRELL